MNDSRLFVFKKWLRDQLIEMVGVQRCAFGQPHMAAAPARDVDLVLTLWTGTVIHIHLLHEPLKPPVARKILSTATEVGIPVLFMLNGVLLTQHKERAAADRWFVPFQALAEDRVYAYWLQDRGPELRPVQFRPYSRVEIETLYGEPVMLTQVRHARIDVTQPALKGYWLLADFENELSTGTAPIRNTDYTQYQYTGPRYEKNGRPQGGTGRANGSQPLASKLDAAYAFLGLAKGASKEQVRAAFRKIALQTHPDVSALPVTVAEERFRLLTAHYEVIKQSNGWD
jgi:hypothetical protein